MPKLRTVSGAPITVRGKRIIGLELDGHICYLHFYVCDVHLPVVSVSRLTAQGYITHLAKDSMSLVSPSGDLITIHCAGPMSYLHPRIVRFDQGTFDFICDSMKFQLAAITLKKDESFVAGAGTTDTSTSKKPIFYHADRWKLEGQTLTRLHKRPRKTLFVPVGTKDLPVDPDELIELRTTEVTFADGRTQTLEDSWRLAEDPTMVLDPTQTWTGKTIFKLKLKPPTTRLSTKTNITTPEEPQLKIVSEGTSRSSSSRPVIVEKRLVDQKHVDFGSESLGNLC